MSDGPHLSSTSGEPEFAAQLFFDIPASEYRVQTLPFPEGGSNKKRDNRRLRSKKNLIAYLNCIIANIMEQSAIKGSLIHSFINICMVIFSN
jgi:hypothetical protein